MTQVHELKFQSLSEAREALDRCVDRLHFFAAGITDSHVGERASVVVRPGPHNEAVEVKGTVVWRYPKSDTPKGKRAGIGLVVDKTSRESEGYVLLTDGLMQLSPPGAHLFALLRLHSALEDVSAEAAQTIANDTHDHVSEDAWETSPRTFVNVKELASPTSRDELPLDTEGNLAQKPLSSEDDELFESPKTEVATPALVDDDEATADGDSLERFGFSDETQSEIMLIDDDELQPLDVIDSDEGTAFAPRPVSMLNQPHQSEEDETGFEGVRTEFSDIQNDTQTLSASDFEMLAPEVRDLPAPQRYPKRAVPVISGKAYTAEKKKRTNLHNVVWPKLGTKREGLFVLDERNLAVDDVSDWAEPIDPIPFDEQTDPGDDERMLLPVAIKLRHRFDGEVTDVFEPGIAVPVSKTVRFKHTKAQAETVEMHVLSDDLEGELELVGMANVKRTHTQKAARVRLDFAADGTLKVFSPAQAMTPAATLTTGIVPVAASAVRHRPGLFKSIKKLFD